MARIRTLASLDVSETSGKDTNNAKDTNVMGKDESRGGGPGGGDQGEGGGVGGEGGVEDMSLIEADSSAILAADDAQV
jgi:hypothetical protein